MTSLRLRDGVHLAWSGGLAIFLDLDADRYSCLAPDHSAVLRDNLKSTRLAVAPGDGEAWARLSAALTKARLLVEATPDEAPAKGLPRVAVETLPPVQRALATDAATPHWIAMAVALAASARARLRQRARPLRDLVVDQTSWSARAVGKARDRRDRVARVAQAFQRTRGVFATRDKCLVEALSLLAALRAHGLHAHWVFGVCAPPFEAHCWVQSGDVVLNDTVDHVRRYTPILVA